MGSTSPRTWLAAASAPLELDRFDPRRPGGDGLDDARELLLQVRELVLRWLALEHDADRALPPGAREIGNLTGAPLREKFLLYAPVDDVAKIRNCAMLFIAAEHEELFDNRQHPQLAYERAADPKKYVVIPGIAHYGIYGEARGQATTLAIDWFDQHLRK